ncbi:hypothetical protein FRC07_003104 [Ceratobasidium sp. 392]|nr:hypothetical protein FRC07_003104 [Ceratobasidium sp. 392]
MSDPQDRRMADLFEAELRHKAGLDPGNAWELIWFLQLPLETRCSYMRILEARIDQHTTRQFLFRQSCYRQSDWRNPTIDCMVINTSVPSRPWASLGKRQRRKPIEYGRSRPYRARKPRLTAPAKPAVPPLPPIAPLSVQHRVFQPEPTPAHIPQNHLPNPDRTPLRPSTPDGLREAVRSDPSLCTHAAGRDPTTLDQQLFSPPVPVTPPEPVKYSPYPLRAPKGSVLATNGKPVPRLFAYLIAAGRHLVAPWQLHTLEEAAGDILQLEALTPGFLSALIKILYPSGPTGLRDAAHPYSSVVLDFVRGWSVVPLALLTGKMPEPVHSVCACGGIRGSSY